MSACMCFTTFEICVNVVSTCAVPLQKFAQAAPLLLPLYRNKQPHPSHIIEEYGHSLLYNIT